MQRFKNLTKKSGKVASAILSAAMVTSMVLGTNVVEVKAATGTGAEAEADVQSTTTNNDQEAVKIVKQKLEETLKPLTANANLTLDEVDYNKTSGKKTLTPYADAIKDLEKQYTLSTKQVLFIRNAKIAVDKPSATKPGTLTLTYEIVRGKGTVGEDGIPTNFTSATPSAKETAKITYTLASNSDRAKAANEALTKALEEYKDKVNNTTTYEDIKEDVVKKALKDDGLNFSDFDVDHNKVGINKLNLATKDKTGSIETTIQVAQLQAGTDGTTKSTTVLTPAVDAQISGYEYTIPSNTERINKASAAISEYLKDARFLDANIAPTVTNGAIVPDTTTNGAFNFTRFVEGKDGRTVKEGVASPKTENKNVGGLRKFLQKDFPDVQIQNPESNAHAEAVSKFEVLDPVTRNTDGKATVDFVLETNAAAFNYSTTDDYGSNVGAYVENVKVADKAAYLTGSDDRLARHDQEETVTLLSDKTKAERAVKDLAEVASSIDATNKNAAEFNELFENAVNEKYLYAEQGKADAELAVYKDGAPTGKTVRDVLQFEDRDITTNKPAASKYTKDFDTNLYYNDSTGILSGGTGITVEFIGDDASAYKDAQPKVVITASFATGAADQTAPNQTSTTTVTEFEKATDSAQTVTNQAKAAIEKALADVNYTNDTTKADVEKVVKDVLAADVYKDVEAKEIAFNLTEATADKEGTAHTEVALENKKNGETVTAVADATFTFYSNTFVEKDGKKYYYNKEGKLLKNTFLQGTESPDGYTYYIQNDGSVMQDRLTYHPNGKEVIYFDKDGHEVFDAFVNVKKDVQGNPVDYIGYFGTLGYAYINQTTYGNGEGAYSKDALFYINDYGVLENKGWFQNAAGNIGYAAANGTLTTNQWGLDQFGRKVYFQANGFLAKGLITDGAKYYQLDENDGHLVGEF